ncbi:uncharacterized protein LOC108838862 isoform X5 [Raphanus sativus]|uniref:Uncharacterized protein LOC108838862 isoform X5 n=1 Tax=Raphanus sativus TaxID=3726 RepID=A0A9W3D1V4_RAPSA|nr:uncharacterized protein LOC108838862 isoform X5 [Raphanus sativus]
MSSWVCSYVTRNVVTADHPHPFSSSQQFGSPPRRASIRRTRLRVSRTNPQDSRRVVAPFQGHRGFSCVHIYEVYDKRGLTKFIGGAVSGGATSTVLKDGTTRANVIWFVLCQRATELKFPSRIHITSKRFAAIFYRSTKIFTRLQSVHCTLQGKSVRKIQL